VAEQGLFTEEVTRTEDRQRDHLAGQRGDAHRDPAAGEQVEGRPRLPLTDEGVVAGEAPMNCGCQDVGPVGLAEVLQDRPLHDKTSGESRTVLCVGDRVPA